MLKLVTIIGARPQIIKAAALSRAIRNNFSGRIEEIIVHTGQHYDDNMSQVFFDEMGVPEPNYNLGIGSASHGRQTAAMIEKLEEVIINEKPDFVVLFGDTNSTLAGSVAASKIHFPVIHIEAGLRSFNKSMPEEINRIVCDHTATLLFTPTKTGLKNLVREGFNSNSKPPFTQDHPGLFHCGDIMLDNSLYFADIAESKSRILEDNKLERGRFILATIHRENNTDIPERLNAIFHAIHELTSESETDIIIPLHPRTSKILKQNLTHDVYSSIQNNKHIKIVPPASFFDTLVLEKNCLMVMTDSGGVQKEAYFFQKPVIILRAETEWVEIVENGAGICTDAGIENVVKAYRYFSSFIPVFPPVFGDGKAAEFICRQILQTEGGRGVNSSG
jgi:UDP-GlcNAc3NAcA epimerase